MARQNDIVSRYWTQLIGDEDGAEGSSVSWFVREAVTRQVSWSWDMNVVATNAGRTNTGFRTPSSCPRDMYNAEWATFGMTGGSRPEISQYSKNDIQGHWAAGYYTQTGQGWDDPQFSHRLMVWNLEGKD